MNIRQDTLFNLIFFGGFFGLAIIAGLVVPRLMDKPDEARWIKTQLQLEKIERALQQYHNDIGQYPKLPEGLIILTNVKKKNGELYLSSKTLIDPWGNPFYYLLPGVNNQTKYDLWSLGADGEIGGEGPNKDLTNWVIKK